MADGEAPNNVVPILGEETFQHTLKDGCVITVGPPKGVIRLKLRNLLGETNYKDDELKTMGTAFLSIRKWNGIPSPLMNTLQFESMMQRFESDEDLDDFMEKWQMLTQPELSKIVKQTLADALDQGLNQEETQKLIAAATLPLAKARLNKIRDLPETPSS